jgi:hypothetical protein
LELYKTKEYLQSAEKYSEAFAFEKKVANIDRYNAACSWALANNDSLFSQLFIIAETVLMSTWDIFQPILI